jgi:hypothetical protein
MRSILLIFLSAFLLGSCVNQDIQKLPAPVYLVFGDYYGKCDSDCVHLYKLEGGALYEDTSMRYTKEVDPASSASITAKRSQEDYEKVKDLRDAFPQKLMEEPGSTIGQPDAGDWGGYYVEYMDGDEWGYWYIDKMQSNLPEYLRPFAQKMEEAIQALR